MDELGFRGLAFACALIGGVGCLTPTSASFHLKDVGPEEAAIAGRLTILYNGEVFNEKCSAFFGGRKLKMSSDGVVLFIVPRGPSGLLGLECQDFSKQHVRISNVQFFAQGRGVVTDFGDVAVTWAVTGGPKAAEFLASLGGLVGAVAAVADDAIDDGVATAVVRPPVAAVREAFFRQTGQPGSWSVPLDPPHATGPLEPVPIVMPKPPAYFCISAPAQPNLNMCGRTKAACEEVLARVPSHEPAACAPWSSAWCFTAAERTHCFGAGTACTVQRARFDGAGPCEEAR